MTKSSKNRWALAGAALSMGAVLLCCDCGSPQPTPMPEPRPEPAPEQSSPQGSPHMHPPTPAPYHGKRDVSPVFVGGSGTVAWLRQNDNNISVCVTAPPYTSISSCHRLPTESYVYSGSILRSSGDGNVLYAGVGEKLVRLTLSHGAVAGEEVIPDGSYSLDMAVAKDGSRVFVETDGLPEGNQSPGWRAVTMYEKNGAQWTKTFLTPAVHPTLSRLIAVQGDGQGALFSEGMADNRGTPERMAITRQTAGGWQDDELSFADLSIRPIALSADGQTLLLQGFPSKAKAPQPSHLYLTRRKAKGWASPQRVVEDNPRASIYTPGLSPDGNQVFWEHYTRDANTITRSEVRMIQAKQGAWTQPTTVFSRQDHFQIGPMSFNGQGQATFQATTQQVDASGDRIIDSFIVHTFQNPVTVTLSKLPTPPGPATP